MMCHGLPDPVNFPENEQRKSIIPYYHTVEPRKNSEILVKEPHSALWKKGDLKIKGKKKENILKFEL